MRPRRGKRAGRKLPFRRRQAGPNDATSSTGSAISRATGGERLKALFGDPKQSRLRYQIIGMWRDMGYREIAPLLIKLLHQHDRFWAGQRLQKGWWSDSSDPEQTRRRQEIYGEVYAAVCTLRSFRGDRARDVLEITRKRWRATDFDNKQIVEECDAALRELVVR